MSNRKVIGFVSLLALSGCGSLPGMPRLPTGSLATLNTAVTDTVGSKRVYEVESDTEIDGDVATLINDHRQTIINNTPYSLLTLMFIVGMLFGSGSSTGFLKRIGGLFRRNKGDKDGEKESSQKK